MDETPNEFERAAFAAFKACRALEAEVQSLRATITQQAAALSHSRAVLAYLFRCIHATAEDAEQGLAELTRHMQKTPRPTEPASTDELAEMQVQMQVFNTRFAADIRRLYSSSSCC